MYDPGIFPFRVSRARFHVRIKEDEISLFEGIVARFEAAMDPRTSWLRIPSADESDYVYSFNVWVDESGDWKGFSIACQEQGIELELRDKPGDIKQDPASLSQADKSYPGDYM